MTERHKIYHFLLNDDKDGLMPTVDDHIAYPLIRSDIGTLVEKYGMDTPVTASNAVDLYEPYGGASPMDGLTAESQNEQYIVYRVE